MIIADQRVRVKDAVNCIWWLSKSPFPRVNMKRVLQPYSSSMRTLLQNGYKPKLRPSGHKISSKFQKDNLGAIPPNLIALANTESNSAYQRYCRQHHLPEHPARFPSGLPAFFIRMLSNRGDLVVDAFAGSCVTGAVAEEMGRRWLCYELDCVYIEGARGRFLNDPNQGQKKPRTKPYEIYPPSVHLLDEKSLPLVEDGGEKRPKPKD